MFSVLYIPILTNCLKINVFGLLKISLRLFMWRNRTLGTNSLAEKWSIQNKEWKV